MLLLIQKTLTQVSRAIHSLRYELGNYWPMTRPLRRPWNAKTPGDKRVKIADKENPDKARRSPSERTPSDNAESKHERADL